MKNNILKLLLIFFSLNFISCSKDIPKPKNKDNEWSKIKNIPKWLSEYSKLKKDKYYLYGVGIGETEAIAINNAINDIVSNLNIKLKDKDTEKIIKLRKNKNPSLTKIKKK